MEFSNESNTNPKTLILNTKSNAGSPVYQLLDYRVDLATLDSANPLQDGVFPLSVTTLPKQTTA
jgi:hypothetical protein